MDMSDNQTVSTTLPIEIDSKWVHMNNIEREKLEWMKDLPKPSAQRTEWVMTLYDIIDRKILSLSFSFV